MVNDGTVYQLTEEDLFKINFIQSAIEELVSKEVIISGMIDQGYATAICAEHKNGKLTQEGLQFALNLLCDELKSVVLEKISQYSRSDVKGVNTNMSPSSR